MGNPDPVEEGCEDENCGYHVVRPSIAQRPSK